MIIARQNLTMPDDCDSFGDVMIWFCFYANIFVAFKGACIVFGHRKLTMTAINSLDIVSDSLTAWKLDVFDSLGELSTQ